jgi:ANTAR domain
MSTDAGGPDGQLAQDGRAQAPAGPATVSPISGERRGDLLAENTRLQTQLDGLHRALRSRAAIEQAKGVLMVFGRCSEADAFSWLTRLSQQRNVRIRVLAEELLRLAEGGFPEADGADGADGAALTGWLRAQVLGVGPSGPARPVPRPNSRR